MELKANTTLWGLISNSQILSATLGHATRIRWHRVHMSGLGTISHATLPMEFNQNSQTIHRKHASHFIQAQLPPANRGSCSLYGQVLLHSGLVHQ